MFVCFSVNKVDLLMVNVLELPLWGEMASGNRVEH